MALQIGSSLDGPAGERPGWIIALKDRFEAGGLHGLPPLRVGFKRLLDKPPRSGLGAGPPFCSVIPFREIEVFDDVAGLRLREPP